MPHPLGQLLLYAAVVLNLPAYFHYLLPRHVEGTTPALLLPVEVEQRTVFLSALATAARLPADDILLNQRPGQYREGIKEGLTLLAA
jgi:hypothetical protein